MTWATLARRLDRFRIPVSCAGALACSLYLAFSAFRWMGETLFVVLIVWFILAFAAIVVALTALLAIAEHFADRAARVPNLPVAIAEYRTPEPEPESEPPSVRVAATNVAPIRPATDAPAFLKGPK